MPPPVLASGAPARLCRGCAAVRLVLCSALALLTAAALLLTPAAPADAKTLKAPAKKFLAQHQQVQQRFAPLQQRLLAVIADERAELQACPAMKRLPKDSYPQTISFLYALIDIIQAATSQARGDLLAAADSYRSATYGDSVLDRAGRVRSRHLRALAELKPFDTCSIVTDWAEAGWPTDWKPTGETWEAARAIYIPAVQIPDESAMLRRLRKLGASNAQVSRAKQHVAASERALKRLDAIMELFPLVTPEWVQWR